MFSELSRAFNKRIQNKITGGLMDEEIPLTIETAKVSLGKNFLVFFRGILRVFDNKLY